MELEKKNLQFKILLGDDRSDHASAALALLEDLPLAAGTDVTVFRAFSPNQATDLVLMEDALNQTCNRLKRKGLAAHPELLLGIPTVKFLKHAEEQKPDLIIIGAKGLRATTGILVGGVAQQVVEYAPCPVLVVRAPYHGIHEVMVVTDGSVSSQHTLEFLGRLPLPNGARLWVMHVLPPPSISMLYMEPPMGSAPIAMLDTEQVAAQAAREERDGQALLDEAADLRTNLGDDVGHRTARQFGSDGHDLGLQNDDADFSWTSGTGHATRPLRLATGGKGQNNGDCRQSESRGNASRDDSLHHDGSPVPGF